MSWRVTFFGRSIASLGHDEAVGQVVIEQDDGTREQADLLVGADGIHSRVRALAFGPEDRFLRQLGYHTAAYVFDEAALHEQLAGEMRLLSVPGRGARRRLRRPRRPGPLPGPRPAAHPPRAGGREAHRAVGHLRQPRPHRRPRRRAAGRRPAGLRHLLRPVLTPTAHSLVPRLHPA